MSRRGLAALLSAAVLATCTSDRAPTGPGTGGRGYLSIRPVLAAPANLAAFGFTIDSLRVAAIRPATDTVVDTTVFFDPNSATLRLALSVPLTSSPETFFLLLQLRAGTQVLYSGVDTTQVSAGAPDTSSSASVSLKYVGPGAGLTSISIAPRDSVVTLLGTKTFRVSADSNGKAISSFYVSWSTSDTLTAPIDSLGVLHAPAARASMFVRAVTPDGVKDSTRVTFIPVPTAVTAFSGGGQTGAVTTRLPLPLRVQVTAADLLGVKGVPVRFQALTGGGSVRDSVVITDSLGFAEDSASLGTLAGAATFQASVTGLTPAAFAATATAGAISAAQSVVTVSAPTLASGAAATLTLQAKDAFGNNLTGGGAIVVFTASGGTSTGSIGSTTDHGNGSYTATFTGVVAGTAVTIGATINGTAVTTTPPTLTVIAGGIAAASSIVSVSSATVASGGSITLTLQAKDAAGNTVTTGGATVLFTRSGGTSTGTIGATTDHADGTYSATFTGAVAGTAATIGATVNGAAVTTVLPTVTVTAGAISAATSVVTTSSGTVAAGAGATLTLQAKDATGNTLTTGGATVVFTAAGGTSVGTIGATTDHGDGTYSATFAGVTAGTATTVRATVNGAATTSSTAITVVPGNAVTAQSIVTVSTDTVIAGGTVTLTLQAKDSLGNNLTAGGLVVVFTRSGGTSIGTIGATTDHNNGTYTAIFTATVAGTATTIGATIGGAPVTSTLPGVTVIPGAISTATSLVTGSAATVASGAAVTLTLQAKDAGGNNLTKGGAVVGFTASGGTSTGLISATTDHNDGTYTATFTGVLAGTATTIGATIGGTAVTSTLPTVTVTPGGISVATSVVTVSDSIVQVGATDTLFLRARDAAGNLLTTGGALVVFTQSAGAGVSAGTISSTADLGTGVYRAIFTGNVSGTPTIIGATISGVSVSSTPLPTIRVSVTTHTVDITADSTWTAAASPHIVNGYLRIRNGATLTIQPGAVVKFNAGSGLQVGDTTLGQSGRLVLDGTGPGITLTANTASPAPGFWKGIEVQRNLALTTWRRALIEWAGATRGPFGGVAAEACVLFVNRSGAQVDLDSVRIRQCTHAGLHHFGGLSHVHRSQIDTVSGSAIHADFDARLEVDSTVLRGATNSGLEIPSPAVRLLPSSGNAVFGSGILAISIRSAQLPGMLRQDTIGGNAANIIEVVAGAPVDTSFTLFRQPRGLVFGNDYDYRISGLLTVSGSLGPQVTLDSNLVVRFLSQSGLVIGDSAGAGTGLVRSSGTVPTNAPRLTSIDIPGSPGEWLGVEVGRLAAADTLRNVRIEFAGDSLPGRTVHRAGLWVRNPVPVPLVLEGVDLSANGSSGAAANSGGLVATANTGGLDVRNSTVAGNPGFGLVVPDSRFRVTGNQVTGNGIGIGAFVQGGSQITTADSIAGNTIAANGYAVALTAAALRAFYDTVVPVNTTDTLLLESSLLTADARLPRVPGFIWHAAGAMTIDSNATFTITPGNTVTFDTLAALLGGTVPAFVKDLPSAPAAITIGGVRPGALAAPGTAAAPIVLTSSVPGRGWAGIQWAFPQGTGAITNNVFTYVTVERAGYYAPCFNDCSPIPFSALRITDSTDVVLSFDHLIVRGSGAFGLDFERGGTGTLTVSNSQFYNNNGGIRALSGHGNQLTIIGSDLYEYRGTVIEGTYGGVDSVNADGNWWGDVDGPYPGFSYADSLGRGSLGGTAVRVATLVGAPFFPLGPAARMIAARDTFLVADTVLSRVGQSDSLRVRVLDAEGRGVVGVPVSWTTTSGSVSPGAGSSDIGGRVATAWQTGSLAGAQRTTASGVGPPVVFPLDLLAGNTVTTTVDWVMEPTLTVADSVHRHAGAGTDTVFYSSSNHNSAFVTHARDAYGNVTSPSFGPLFDQGPCAGFACRFPAADSTKGDTVFFRPPVIGDYVISGLYESGAGGSDQIVLRVNPVASGVRIDRDVTTPGVQDTGDFTYNSQCRVGAPVNIYCARQFDAFVVDSGGAPIVNSFGSFDWISPAGDTTVTLDSIRGPANDNAFVSAHADGKSFLVTVDINDASPTFGKRDSMPIVVQQRPGNLIITPSADTLAVGDSTEFTATITDQGGDTMPAVAVHWRSDPTFAGLTILDTAVAHKIKVRLDSAPLGEAHLTAVACCTIAQPPFDSLFGLATVANPVQIAVSVGTSPGDVSVNPVTRKAYVALGTDSVAVLDLQGDSLRKRIPVPSPTYWTAVNTTTNRVYVGSNSSGTGYVIDGAADAVVGSFNVGASPFVAQMAVDEARNRLYVPMEICVGTPLCSTVRFLGVLDGATLGLIDTVRIGHQGIGTAYDPTLNRIYVATSAGPSDTVKVIDATTLQVVDSIGVGAGVYAVASNPVTGKVYVTNSVDHTVSVIDGATNSVSATVSLGFSTPNDIAVDTIADLVYVAVSDNSFQFVIDGAGNTVRAILLDGYTTGVAVTPARGPVVFTQFNQNAAKILRF